jgi:hypothetical protein
MRTSPYATPVEVAALFGPIDDQKAKVDLLLDFAAALLRSRVPQLQARLDEGTLEEGAVVSAVTAMVVRVLNNPRGKRQVSSTAGPFTESWTVDQAVSSGALYVSESELADLAPAPASRRIGSIRIAPSWR